MKRRYKNIDWVCPICGRRLTSENGKRYHIFSHVRDIPDVEVVEVGGFTLLKYDGILFLGYKALFDYYVKKKYS